MVVLYLKLLIKESEVYLLVVGNILLKSLSIDSGLINLNGGSSLHIYRQKQEFKSPLL